MRHAIVLLALFCVSCSSSLPSLKPYRMEIQQGNVINSKMMLQLRPDMTKSQVRFILGTPLIQDSFHKDRWDYLYQLRKGGVVIEQRRVILSFENDLLKRVRGDVIPGDTNPAVAAAAPAVANKLEDKPKVEEKKSLTDSLKFWQGDKEAEQAIAANQSGFTKELEVPPALLPATAAATTSALLAPAEAKASSGPAQAAKPAQTQVLSETLIAPAPSSTAPAANALPATSAAAAASLTATATSAEQSMPEPEAAVSARVNAWADAWRQKDINRYFSFYAAKFVPESASSKASWIEQRKQRLSKTGSITVDISDVKVYAKDTRAKVDFVQHYASEGYSDNVAKTLQFELIYGSWMIVRESAGTKLAATASNKANPKTRKVPASPVVEDDSQAPGLTPEQKSASMPASDDTIVKPIATPVEVPAAAPIARPAIQKPAEREQVPAQTKPAQKNVVPEKIASEKSVQEKSTQNNPAASNKAVEDAPDENPGLFERMLEKIGF